MKKTEIEERCTNLVMPILDEGGYELWDVEYVKEGADFYLRVYADKEGGINIDDCVLISRALDKKLDEEDFIKDAYILEVSSPGLTRPLRKERDFERCIGRMIDVHFYKAVDGMKETEGELKAFTEKTITVGYEDGDVEYERENISGVRLAFMDEVED